MCDCTCVCSPGWEFNNNGSMKHVILSCEAFLFSFFWFVLFCLLYFSCAQTVDHKKNSLTESASFKFLICTFLHL